MKRTLKMLEVIQDDLLLGKGCIRCDEYDCCPDAFTEVSHYCGAYLPYQDEVPDPTIKNQLANAFKILQEYCNSQDTCGDCVFSDCRDDCGFICRVNQLVSDERYERAVGAKKEPQPQLWRED